MSTAVELDVASLLRNALVTSHPRRRAAERVYRLRGLSSHPQYHRFPLVQKRLEALEGAQKYPLPTPSMVERGIAHAEKCGMTVSCGIRSVVIEAPPTPPVTFEEDGVEVKLGAFVPGLHFRRRLGNENWHWDAKAHAVEPNDSHNGYVHPHIDDGYICLGNIADSVNRYVYECHFDAALFLISDGLTQYNPESPYQRIAEWFTRKETCESCSYSGDPDEEGGYDASDYWFCNECGIRIDDQWVSREETFECPVCDCRRLEEDERECPCCGDPVCRRCLEQAFRSVT